MVNSKGDKVFEAVLLILILLVGLVCVIPILYVVSVSLTPIEEKLRAGGFLLIPRHITLSAYKNVLSQGDFLNSMWVSVRLTVVGTALNLIATTLFAYPLSRRNLPGRKLVMKLVVFTMVFNAGMIPTYLVVKNVGLLNTFWSLIIPGLVSVYNFIIMESFFEGLPEELFESARLDGASEMLVLRKIVLPLSLPILLTISLYYAVDHWNTYLTAVLYITRNSLMPLQVMLRRLLLMSKATDLLVDDLIPTETLQMASVVVATVPVVVIYPFIQKYFVKGTLAGAVKG